jgi:C-terminal processing protease CtpA/Prc
MEFDSQRMIITSLRPGCAAAYSKQITIGDQIVAVDGEEVRVVLFGLGFFGAVHEFAFTVH